MERWRKKGHNHRTWDWCCLNSVGNQKWYSWNLEQTLGLFPRFIAEAWKSSVRETELCPIYQPDHRDRPRISAGIKLWFHVSVCPEVQMMRLPTLKEESLLQNTFQNYGETIGNQFWNYELVLDSQMWCGQRRLVVMFSEFFTVLWYFLLWMNPIQD